MTIATFCRDELLAHGPLTLDELTDRAVQAGVTRSATPRSTVSSAIRYRELELTDGRLVTPLWLLEGRCLTTPALGVSDWCCDPSDTSSQDLGVLHRAANLTPIPLVGGGMLRRRGWQDAWTFTRPLPTPAPGELLCFRIIGAALDVTTVPFAATCSPSSDRFVSDLNGPHPRRRFDEWDPGASVERRLADLLVADDTLLRTPVPPLSLCSDVLASEVRRLARTHPEPRYVEPWDDVPWDGTPWDDLPFASRQRQPEARALRLVR
jgi:hypothetical protein